MKRFMAHKHLQTLLCLSTFLGSALAMQSSSMAQVTLTCKAESIFAFSLSNQAESSYSDDNANNSFWKTFSSAIKTDVSIVDSSIQALPQGIKDSQGNMLVSLGVMITALESSLTQKGMTAELAENVSLTALKTFLNLRPETPQGSVFNEIRRVLNESFPAQQTFINQLSDEEIALALTGTAKESLLSFGLNLTDGQAAEQGAISAFRSLSPTTAFSQTTEQMQGAVIRLFPNSPVAENLTALNQELARVRSSKELQTQLGKEIIFEYLLQNTGRSSAKIQIPTAQTIQNEGLTGSGTVLQVTYSNGQVITGDSTNSTSEVTLAPREAITLSIKVQPNNFETSKINTVGISLSGGCGDSGSQQKFTIFPRLDDPLVDPFGRITGCAGELLSDYRGMSVALYNADLSDPTGGIAGLTPLTITELPDNPNNSIPKGLAPNIENSNPFYLTNQDQGVYTFLLDEKRGQLDQGKTYILLVNPPQDSIYEQRRIRIVIGDRNGNIVSYTATSLDGKPINATDGKTSVQGVITIDDANAIGLTLGVLDLSSSVCQGEEIRITKTADRAAAEPGDTVLYRLTVRSQSNALLNNVQINDTLPVGLIFEPKATRASLNGETVEIEVDENGRNLTFILDRPLDQGDILNIIYAAQVTPEAIRGNGKNLALVQGNRTDVGTQVKDGPAIHSLTIRQGIISDCGTLIGRVFVDQNFDGLQQPGEPGVPNAVIYLQDGNRITTDADGLFSLANVLPGYHVGVLDLTSIPGYAIAPNIYFSEGNSKSRMVRLAPGSMVKMNFAVTPAVKEEQ
jgi:uncharacterized repeat protein (TIGR01451 family)